MKNELMEAVEIHLREKLDTIDEEVAHTVHDGCFKSRLRVLVGMWEKGEAISSVYPSRLRNWNQLEKETGRRDVSLKSWHDLYQKYPDKKKYLSEYAEPKAEARAEGLFYLKEKENEE